MILAKGMGRVLSCLYDIVGNEDYTRIVEEFRSKDKKGENKPLPETGEEIPEEIEGEEDVIDE